MVGHAIELHRRRTRHLLFAFLVGSVAVHAAALVVLPRLPIEGETPGVRVLEVVLVQIEPPQSLPVEPASAPPVPERKVAATRLPTEIPRRTDAPVPVLALPQPLAAVVPEIAAPPAETRAAPRAATTEAGTIAATAAVTPPSFSAAYLRNPPPRYPMAARRAGEQGTVTLRVLVTREGLPARVDVEKTSGSPHLDNAALETVSTWRFAPARQGSVPVESWVLVPVVFRLEGSS